MPAFSSKLRTVLATAATVLAASGALAASARAVVPGAPTFAGCVGDLSGCTATTPVRALDGASGLAVTADGKQLYATSFGGNAVSHLSIDAAGDPTFVGCVGDLTGCAATTPTSALDGASAAAVTPDGKQLYTTSLAGNVVSHFTLDAAGNMTFAGCIGDLTGCTAASPTSAIDGAYAVTASADGKQLYTASLHGNVVSHFRIGGAGNLTFAGCIGDLTGCTTTTPATALDGADGVAVTPDGTQLYAASVNGNVVSHFTIDTVGNLTFAGCVGDLAGCTATNPATALDGTARVALTADGKHLYATSIHGHAVSHFTIGPAGNLAFAGCIGDLTGCTATRPKTVLDGAFGVAVTPDGKQLYTASVSGNAVSEFTIDAAGNLTYGGCTGDETGCTPTTPGTALDGAFGVAVTPDGSQLYTASLSGNVVSHFATALPPPIAIAIAAPQNGATYTQGQVVDAAFSCGGLEVASCTATVANGAAIDTSTLGAHEFTVTASTGIGLQTTTRSARYTVVATPPIVATRPVVANVRQSHRTWRESRSRRKTPPVGTTFSFTLNEQATTTFAFSQQTVGRKGKSKCVTQTDKNHRKPACTLTVISGTLSFIGHPGTNTVSFRGSLPHSKRLKPGRYALAVGATDAAGQHASPQTLAFTIVKS